MNDTKEFEPMHEQAEAHLKSVLAEATELIDAKYRAGQREHGGFLGDKGVLSLLDSSIEEAVDQVVYLVTARQRLRKAYGPSFVQEDIDAAYFDDDEQRLTTHDLADAVRESEENLEQYFDYAVAYSILKDKVSAFVADNL